MSWRHFRCQSVVAFALFRRADARHSSATGSSGAKACRRMFREFAFTNNGNGGPFTIDFRARAKLGYLGERASLPNVGQSYRPPLSVDFALFSGYLLRLSLAAVFFTFPIFPIQVLHATPAADPLPRPRSIRKRLLPLGPTAFQARANVLPSPTRSTRGFSESALPRCLLLALTHETLR